ncbi:unnamed protein product [Victoria cruziana]
MATKVREREYLHIKCNSTAINCVDNQKKSSMISFRWHSLCIGEEQTPATGNFYKESCAVLDAWKSHNSNEDTVDVGDIFFLKNSSFWFFEKYVPSC